MKNHTIYDISCQTLIGANPLRIIFDDIDRFIKSYDEVRYSVLFSSENMLSIIKLDIL